MEQPAGRWQQSAGAMGTTFTVVLYGGPHEEMEAAAAAALDEAVRLEQLLSRYLPDSEVSRINRAAVDRRGLHGADGLRPDGRSRHAAV